jgi:hypothetical protein
MDRMPMSSWTPAEVAERLSDLADGRCVLRFNPYDREDIAACVPGDLVDPIQALLECRGSTVEAFEEALKKLEIALGERFADL